MKIYWSLVMFATVILSITCKVLLIDTGSTGRSEVNLPVWTDIPDLSAVRNGDNFYMSSTTMHMNPYVPIMKSKDLIYREIVSYAAEAPEGADNMNLNNNRNVYGRESGAGSLRFNAETWYVSTFSNTSIMSKFFVLKFFSSNIAIYCTKTSAYFNSSFISETLFFV